MEAGARSGLYILGIHLGSLEIVNEKKIGDLLGRIHIPQD